MNKILESAGIALDAVCAIVITLLMFTVVPKILGIVLTSPIAKGP